MMSTESRALELLAQGLPGHVVATACGVSESRISQLQADEEFARQLAEKKYARISTAASLDGEYDEVEKTLIGKLKSQIPLIYKPGEILRTLQVVNAAKRRGTILPETGANAHQRVVQVVLPQVIVNKFTTNILNQVVEVKDDQGNSRTLVTTSSASLQTLARRTIESAEARKQASAIKHEQDNAKVSSERLRESSRAKAEAFKDEQGNPISLLDAIA